MIVSYAIILVTNFEFVNPLVIDLDEDEIPLYESFFKIYEAQHSIYTDCKQKTFLGTKNRTCRFCSRKFPEVKFTFETHVIPQSIGNRYLLNNFECNECNRFFSKYEDSFVNFVSHLRPFAGVVNKNRKNKRVKHKERKTGLEIHSNKSGVEFYLEKSNTNILKIDYEKLTVDLEVTVPPYVPIFVYKTLLKIALCCVDEAETELLRETFAFLRTDTVAIDVLQTGYFKVFVTKVPGEFNAFNKPFGVLYRKKQTSKDENNPAKVFSLYFANRVFQIFLPFSNEDKNLVGKKFKVLRAPTPIEKTYTKEYGKPFKEIIDLSSNILVKGSKEILSMKFLEGEFFKKHV
jgi:hypothetical protein